MKKIILIICLTCITTIQAQENDINEKYKKYEKMFFELKVPITPVIAFNSEQFPEVSGTIQLDKNDNIKKRNDYKNYLKNEIKLIKKRDNEIKQIYEQIKKYNENAENFIMEKSKSKRVIANTIKAKTKLRNENKNKNISKFNMRHFDIYYPDLPESPDKKIPKFEIEKIENLDENENYSQKKLDENYIKIRKEYEKTEAYRHLLKNHYKEIQNYHTKAEYYMDEAIKYFKSKEIK